MAQVVFFPRELPDDAREAEETSTVTGRSVTTRWMAALALTLALALQAVLGAAASAGAAPGAPLLDAFGFPICSTSTHFSAADEGQGSPAHSSLPDCCTVACSMFWPQLPAPLATFGIDRPREIAVVDRPLDYPELARPPRDEGGADPRAPPTAA